jgi:hypothetical protein
VDLAGIRFSGFDPGKSIISPRYTPGPVLIGDPAKPEALVDARQKFFPAVAAPANAIPGPVPDVLQPIKPAYGTEYRAVTGTAPDVDQWMRHP